MEKYFDYEGQLVRSRQKAAQQGRLLKRQTTRKHTGYSLSGRNQSRGVLRGEFLFGLWDFWLKDNTQVSRIFLFDEMPTMFIDPETAIFYIPISDWSNGYNEIAYTDMLRYLKTSYSNMGRLKNNFINELNKTIDRELPAITELFERIQADFNSVKPFSYKEAFELDNAMFQSLVFGTIDIASMISELGSNRIATAGKEVRHKQFDKTGDFLGYKDYHVVFETHVVSGSKLGLRESLYAVRCWCTTTESEHWLWIEQEYARDPLTAIASTFRVHENVVPHIKELKRQGDILLVELDTEVDPAGDMVALSADQYFELLTAQS